MQRKRKNRLRTVVCLALCAGLLSVTLTGCGKAYKDGTYTARYRYPNGGYVEYLTVTLKGGRPVEARYDGYRQNAPDVNRSDVEKDTQWAKQNERFTRNILAAGTKAEKIGIVTGMTAETQRVRTLYAAILNAAKEGRTTEIVVDNKPEKDSSLSNSDMTGSDPSSDSMSDSSFPDSTEGSSSDSGADGDNGAMSDSDTSGSMTDSGLTGESGSGATDSDNANGESGTPDTGSAAENSGSTGN